MEDWSGTVPVLIIQMIIHRRQLPLIWKRRTQVQLRSAVCVQCGFDMLITAREQWKGVICGNVWVLVAVNLRQCGDEERTHRPLTLTSKRP